MNATQLGFFGQREHRSARRMESVIFGSTSSPVIAQLLSLKFPDGDSAMDLTYGRGGFWPAVRGWRVVGFDAAPRDGIAALADATCVPVRAAAVDVAVFDPPYMKARRGTWIHAARYGQLDERGLGELARGAAAEMRRVARLGAIVKVQDVMDGYKPLWHSYTVFDAFRVLGYEPTELITFIPSGGRIVGWNWRRQFSVRRVHSLFFVYEWEPRRRAKDRLLTDIAESAAPAGAAVTEVGPVPS